MSGLTGTWQLIRLVLRLDRVRLPLWVLAITLVVGASAQAVQGLYETPEQRAGYAVTAQSPAAIVMSGPPQALDTVGGITVFETNLTALVGVALMAIFLTVRHMRAEEETGRTELLSAGVLGRHAQLAATLLVVGAASVLLGALLAGTLVGLGLPTGGSLVFGAGVAALGIFFAGVGAVASQVSEHARAASGLGLAVLGLAWALRSLGDVREGWLSWLSPVGWVQAVRPFGEDRWWPLLLPILLAVGLAALAAVIEQRRDVGAGLVASRPGPPRASTLLGSVPGLAWREQRSSVLWWTLGMLLMGLLLGAFAEDVEDLVGDNPAIRDAFGPGGAENLVAGYFGMILLILALIAACFTVGSVHRLHLEEATGRAEYVLATRTGRARWQLAWLAVTGLGTVLVVLAAAAGVVTSDALVAGNAERAGELIAGMLTYLPAVAVLGGLAAALHGWAPRLALLTWVLLAGCFVVGWLGGLLGIPDAVMDLSPFTLTPRVPLEDMDWPVVAGLAGVAVVLVVLGVLGLRRRDVVTNA